MSDSLANLMLSHGAGNLWWMPAGEKWIDIGPSSQHADIFNTAGAGRPLLRSRTAASLRLDGYSTYARVTGIGTPHVTQQWSLEFWVNFDSVATFRTIYQTGSSNNAVHVQTRNNASPGIDITIEYINVLYQQRIPGGTITAGQDAHVVITFDTDTILAYVNGQSVSLSSGTLSPVVTSNLLLGRSNTSQDNYLQGWLGPVANYPSVALTAQQVSEHHRLAGAFLEHQYRSTDPSVTGSITL